MYLACCFLKFGYVLQWFRGTPVPCMLGKWHRQHNFVIVTSDIRQKAKFCPYRFKLTSTPFNTKRFRRHTSSKIGPSRSNGVFCSTKTVRDYKPELGPLRELTSTKEASSLKNRQHWRWDCMLLPRNLAGFVGRFYKRRWRLRHWTTASRCEKCQSD